MTVGEHLGRSGDTVSRGGHRDPPHGRRGRGRAILITVLLVVISVFFTGTGRAMIAPAVVKLRLAAPSVFGDGDYAFLHTFEGEPWTFYTCGPLRIVINEALRPIRAVGLVEEAVEEASKASGLEMEIVGRTNEQPGPGRDPTQARYGPGWAPILIAWTSPEVVKGLEGDPVGLGGPGYTTDSASRGHYLSGQVSLDSPTLKQMLEKGRSDDVRAVIMHELGHVLGLAHVNSPFELMYERTGALTQYGPGDREGLARLGRAACD